MDSKTLKASLILVLVLALGVLAGATGAGWLHLNESTESSNSGDRRDGKERKGPSFHDLMNRRLLHGLELTDEQRGNIDQVMANMKKDLETIHEPWVRQMDEIVERTGNQIKAQLSDEQKLKMDENLNDTRRSFRPPSRDRDDWKKKADTDGDGEVSEEEKDTYWSNWRKNFRWPVHWDSLMERTDKNGDGILDEDEIAAARKDEEERRQRGPSRRGGPSSGGSRGPGGPGDGFGGPPPPPGDHSLQAK